jgi:hypothetical protein
VAASQKQPSRLHAATAGLCIHSCVPMRGRERRADDLPAVVAWPPRLHRRLYPRARRRSVWRLTGAPHPGRARRSSLSSLPRLPLALGAAVRRLGRLTHLHHAVPLAHRRRAFGAGLAPCVLGVLAPERHDTAPCVALYSSRSHSQHRLCPLTRWRRPTHPLTAGQPFQVNRSPSRTPPERLPILGSIVGSTPTWSSTRAGRAFSEPSTLRGERPSFWMAGQSPHPYGRGHRYFLSPLRASAGLFGACIFRREATVISSRP